MKLIIIGYGRMGRLIETTAAEAGDTIAATFDTDNLSHLASTGKIADVAMDFSAPSTQPAVHEYIRRTGTAYLAGYTGMDKGQSRALRELGNYAPVLYSANYSLGIAVFYRALREISGILKPDFDVEITETHHNQKIDAPSGTANMLLDAIDPEHELTPVYGREGICGKRGKSEVGMHSLRGGNAAGTHTVHFFGTDEELEITHHAFSRRIFVNGALKMARLLVGKPAGIYDMQTLLFGDGTRGEN